MSFKTATLECDRCGRTEPFLNMADAPKSFFPFQMTIQFPPNGAEIVGHICDECMNSGAPLFGNVSRLTVPDHIPKDIRA